MRLLPAIDLRQGRCVRLYQGNFAAETRYAYSPEELLDRYRGWGANWVHVVDLDAARGEPSRNRRMIERLAKERSIRLQVGGGVRSAAEVQGLLESGVARVVIGSLAAEKPNQVCTWLEQFPAEQLCLAFDVQLDAQAVPRVRTRGWTHERGVSLSQALDSYAGSALKHVLCTDIARDGTLSGPNLTLYAGVLKCFPQLAVQASGGIRDGADLQALAETGVAAAVCGKALLEERMTLEELKPFLPDESFPASTCATARS